MDRLPWLATDVRPVIGWVVLAVVCYSAFIGPVLRRRVYRGDVIDWRSRARLRRAGYAVHLAIAPLLLLGGVDPRALGLALPATRTWTVATLLTAGVLVAAAAVAVNHRIEHAGHGCYEYLAADRRRFAVEAVVGGIRDAFLFVALPMFVASATHVEIGWLVVLSICGYGFHHMPNGFEPMIAWTAITAVLASIYLASGSLLLPAVAITGTAIIWAYALPAGPEPAQPVPPLVLVEEPAPLT